MIAEENTNICVIYREMRKKRGEGLNLKFLSKIKDKKERVEGF